MPIYNLELLHKIINRDKCIINENQNDSLTIRS